MRSSISARYTLFLGHTCHRGSIPGQTNNISMTRVTVFCDDLLIYHLQIKPMPHHYIIDEHVRPVTSIHSPRPQSTAFSRLRIPISDRPQTSLGVATSIIACAVVLSALSAIATATVIVPANTVTRSRRLKLRTAPPHHIIRACTHRSTSHSPSSVLFSFCRARRRRTSTRRVV